MYLASTPPPPPKAFKIHGIVFTWLGDPWVSTILGYTTPTPGLAPTQDMPGLATSMALPPRPFPSMLALRAYTTVITAPEALPPGFLSKQGLPPLGQPPRGLVTLSQACFSLLSLACFSLPGP